MLAAWTRVAAGFRTIRMRLAVQYLLALILILVAICTVVLAAWDAYIRREFDEFMLEEAQVIIADLGPDPSTWRPYHPPHRAMPPTSPLKFGWLFYQAVAPDGTLLLRSENLGQWLLPLPKSLAAALAAGPEHRLLTIDPRDLPLAQSKQMRLLSLPVNHPPEAPYLFQMAGSMAPVAASAARLRNVFLTVGPIGLLLATFISWLLAGRALAPLADIVQQAEVYTAAHLDRRLVRPARDDELGRLVQVINGMLDRLAAAFSAQQRFIADASHELKTPLSILLAEAEMLAQKERPAERHKQFLASVQEQLRQLTQVIDSLLMLARADAGFPLVKTEPISLNDVATEAAQRCEALASARPVRIVPHLAAPADGLPEPIVRGDRRLLLTAVENLLRNAVRFSPVQRVVEIEVRVDARDGTINVRDSGPGIPPHRIDGLFRRFFQIPTDGQTPQGAGLGLAIAYGVVRLHEGTIAARNRPAGGAEFTVTLPLCSDS